MTDYPPLPALDALEEIRLRVAQRAAHPKTEAEGEAISDAMALLAALDAALKATDPFDDDQTLGGTFLAAIHWNVRQAIAAVLVETSPRGTFLRKEKS